MEFLLKTHKGPEGSVVAACDAEILGKCFEDGELIIKIDKRFFGGKPAKIDEIVAVIKEFSTANIVGNRIIAELVKMGFLDESGVKEIASVKYAHVFKV